MAERPAERPPAALRLGAPAKLNLGLRVLARRPDGFHEIDTLFARLDLTDEVEVALAPAGTGIGGEVLPPDDPALPSDPLAMDEGNLMVRAARAWLEATGSRVGVRMRLRKRIPMAAGLGGGSSDAAAALRALARLAPVPGGPAGGSALALRIAGGIGSDVPFFLLDAPLARARGRGERLEPLPWEAAPGGWAALLNPGVPVSAAEAYRALRAFGEPLDPDALLADLRAGRTPAWSNDLQPGVTALRPEVAAALEALAALPEPLGPPLMSGSGATCFALAPDRRAAEAAVARLRADRPGWWAAAARWGAA